MSAKSKQRLDQLLVDLGLADSRTKAQAIIMAGQVSVNGSKADKPGQLVPPDVAIELSQTLKYVSRGGDKLASVADKLGLDFGGKTILDVGASTGGFTDYALQNGAAKATAVDVGTGQLDWRLRNDNRVEVHEQTDIREFESDQKVDMALIDVSFVSILKVIDEVAALIKPGGQIVAMIKPQFEAGKSEADKYHGVISDPKLRQEILDQVKAGLSNNYLIKAEADSSVHGPKGNIEHLVLLAPKH